MISVFKMMIGATLLCASAGCSHHLSQPAAAVSPLPQPATISVGMPINPFDSVYQGLRAHSNVIRTYKRGNYEFEWMKDDRIRAGDSLRAFIENLIYNGLIPGDYHSREIRQRLNEPPTIRNKQRLDAMLTDAFFCISHDLKYGKSNRVNVDSAMVPDFSQLGDITKYFESLEPRFTGYLKLKSELTVMLNSMVKTNAIADIEPQLHPRLASIIINMERWRLEPGDFGDRYVFINIPSYMLYVIEHDSVVFESKVIVGNTEWETPELSSVIDCIITFPFWYVPRKIAVEEYLVAIQLDTSFVRKNNFDVLDRRGKILDPASVPWATFNKDNFPVALRQREGPDNSLGVIKFVFDNPYAVFLHDTNAKRLFRSKQRALSHGCVRVEKAVDLAHYFVTGISGKKSVLIEKYLSDAERHYISLTDPVPVHIRYITCDSPKGKMEYYPDIYKKDQQLINTFFNKESAIVSADDGNH